MPRDKPLDMVEGRAGTQGYSSYSAIGTGRIADKGGVRISLDKVEARAGVSADTG